MFQARSKAVELINKLIEHRVQYDRVADQPEK